MPFYTIHHSCPLSISQQDELAAAITNIHATKFVTPKAFVNVSFEDKSSKPNYVAGKRQPANVIMGQVRTGPSRTDDDWEELIRAIAKAWDEICGTPLPRLKGREEADTALRGVFLQGGRVSGMEMGVMMPRAGDEGPWLKKNWAEFSRKAEAGEPEFVDLVKDVDERGLLQGTEESEDERMRREQKRLEEELGWGDAA